MKLELDTPWPIWLTSCSIRLRNGLRHAGAETLRDVVSMTEHDFLAERNIGDVTVRELKRRLGDLGLLLGEPPEDPVIPRFDRISLRDYFAAKALRGMLANPKEGPIPGEMKLAESFAAAAYDLADAMLAERKKGGA